MCPLPDALRGVPHASHRGAVAGSDGVRALEGLWEGPDRLAGATWASREVQEVRMVAQFRYFNVLVVQLISSSSHSVCVERLVAR